MVAVGEDAAARRARRPGSRAKRIGSATASSSAGERRADAEVDAGAEGELRAGRPGRIEPMRVGEAGRVAVGGGEQAADGVAAAEAVAEELDVLAARSG